MNQSFSTTREHSSRGRRALGLFAAVWLNLALAPCAMAYGADGDHDCRHCPPTEMQGHHGMHDATRGEAPCADGLSNCNLDDGFSLDSRGSQCKLKDAQFELPVVIVATDLSYPGVAPLVEPLQPPAGAGYCGARPPLHLLNCVFLD